MSDNFEQRRRERLRRQRKQRERLRALQIILSVILLILVIIITVVGITRCAKKKSATSSAVTGTLMTTPAPAGATAEPTAEPSSAAYGEIPAPEVGNNDLLDVISESGEKKHAYLTFDDGPTEAITPQILDTLRRYNIKATFFMVGKNIDANPQLCARVIQEGHLAAVHSYTHEYDTVYSDSDTFRDELERTYSLIVENSPEGEEPFKLFRFPGGSFESDSYGSVKGTYKNVLAKEGFYYADWNSLNGDAEGRTKDAEGLLEYFNMYKPNTNNLVVLMHDAEDKQATADMLANLIQQLIDEGFEFNRLDEIDFSNKPAETPSTSVSDADDDTGDTASKSDRDSDTDSDTNTDTDSDTSSDTTSATARPKRTPSASTTSNGGYTDEADPEINQ